MGSTSNILTIRPPRSAESRPQSGQESETLCGSLSVVSALDLIEWLCANRKIWSLRFYSRGPGQGHGSASHIEVVVVDGQIVDARWGDVRGLPALCEIVGCQKGSFELVPVSGSIERTLHGHWQSLLLSAVQMLDERNHHNRSGSQADRNGSQAESSPDGQRSTSSSGGSVERVLIALPPAGQTQAGSGGQGTPTVAERVSGTGKEASASMVALSVEDLIDHGFAALHAGNPAEARHYWTRALAREPDNRSLQFNLRKLDSAD